MQNNNKNMCTGEGLEELKIASANISLKAESAPLCLHYVCRLFFFCPFFLSFSLFLTIGCYGVHICQYLFNIDLHLACHIKNIEIWSKGTLDLIPLHHQDCPNRQFGTPYVLGPN